MELGHFIVHNTYNHSIINELFIVTENNYAQLFLYCNGMVIIIYSGYLPVTLSHSDL